jgi:hypothetical protein
MQVCGLASWLRVVFCGVCNSGNEHLNSTKKILDHMRDNVLLKKTALRGAVMNDGSEE